MSDAVREWQKAVVAIGLQHEELGNSELFGTGFLVDMRHGLVVTCARFVLYAFYTRQTGKDPGVDGLAVGLGVGEQITWACCAKLRYISCPPASYDENPCRHPGCKSATGERTTFGPQLPPPGHSTQQRLHTRRCPICGTQSACLTGPPPEHWRAGLTGVDDERLDVAVLQLVAQDGTTLDAATVLARDGAPARALALGFESGLADGDDLVMLGFGQDGTGHGAEQTSTTTFGKYAGAYSSALPRQIGAWQTWHLHGPGRSPTPRSRALAWSRPQPHPS